MTITRLIIPAFLASSAAAADLTAEIAVGASDIEGSPLTYTWTTISKPTGSGTPTFANRTLTAGETSAGYTNGKTVTLVNALAGTYQFQCTISDGGQSSTSLVSMTVGNNQAPTISSISNQTTDEDTATSAITFTIADAELTSSLLAVSATSGNTALVASNGISLGGSGGSRTITLSPLANQSGTAAITIGVSDGGRLTTSSFILTVTAVNDVPIITMSATVSPQVLTLP